MSVTNIDGLLAEAAQPITNELPIAPESVEIEAVEPQQDEKVEIAQAQEEEIRETPIASEKEEVKADTNMDEYGNPVAPAKMYSEEEVQRMIRDRLSRGSYAQQQATNPEIKEAVKGFEHDPSNDDSWQEQLEEFIGRTLEKRETARSRQQMQQQESARQAEFEAKFNAGMSKYEDFKEIVGTQPITDAMLLAARQLNDPAAFIYAASKHHAKELENIARISDPYGQAAAVGRLEEKMRKVRGGASNAPRPIANTKGDVAEKNSNAPINVDDRISQYGKQKFTRTSRR